MFRQVGKELKEHMPFTALGSLSGIVIVVVIVYGGFLSQIAQVAHTVFYVLHPLHVVLSALVTAALYRKYGNNRIWAVVLVGYFGSIGVATISDSVIPYLGEAMLNLPNKGLHIGFIEEWWIVNPAALLGIALSYAKPLTKVPHFGHVLISTWASLFHVVMALGVTLDCFLLLAIFIFLFLAVWLPCCLSDIVFPLLFTGKKLLPQEVKHIISPGGC